MVKKSWRDILETLRQEDRWFYLHALTTGEVFKCENGIITIQYKRVFFYKQD